MLSSLFFGSSRPPLSSISVYPSRPTRWGARAVARALDDYIHLVCSVRSCLFALFARARIHLASRTPYLALVVVLPHFSTLANISLSTLSKFAPPYSSTPLLLLAGCYSLVSILPSISQPKPASNHFAPISPGVGLFKTTFLAYV